MQANVARVATATSSDVLIITVPVPGRYPSVNHTHDDGFRGGRKSPEYRALKLAVRKAAHAAMKRHGWTAPAPWYVAIDIVRIVPDRRRRDRMNIGKAELDALEPARPGDDRDETYDPNNPTDPFPGVYQNDDLALAVPHIELDLGGTDRVVIVARRCYPRLHDFATAASALPRKATRKRSALLPVTRDSSHAALPASQQPTRAPFNDGLIPPGYALCDGRPVPMEEALRDIRGESKRGVHRRRARP